MHDAFRSASHGRVVVLPEAHVRAAVPAWKRLLDVAVALVALVVLSPLIAVAAVVVALDSPGGALFKQRRIGLRGAPFEMYKFRTMVAGNDCAAHRQYVAKLIREGSADLKNSVGAYKIENDPRLTSVGPFLRKSSLDELPQLLNVLKGEMSLVGPRPPLEYEYELYSPRQRRRMDVTPGMTGLWQVSGRNATTFDEMIELDLEYVYRRSLGLDLRILLATIPTVLRARGA